MAKNIIRPVKGTIDFYPEQMAIRNWLYANIRCVSRSFGYQEWEAPLLETLELYAAKSGEELVQKQSFVFKDRGGKMVALRPELTPSLARMVAQKQDSLNFPLRWWSYGPFWRYERPQRGRTREFFQWNIDLIGANSPEADAELAAIAARFFEACGLPAGEIVVFVNNRSLMDAQLTAAGIPPKMRPELFTLIDRRDKMPHETWQATAIEMGLSSTQFEVLLGLLENNDLWQESEELTRFFEAADALGVSNYLQFAPYIIRGLDYYTGTVFEARDKDQEFRTILGGGRYNNLVSDVGGWQVPAVGFAMGDKVIELVLKKYGRLPSSEQLLEVPVLITMFDQDATIPALKLAADLRAGGLAAAIYPEPARLNKQFKYANKLGARVALILGPNELAGNTVAVKDLSSGEQNTVSRDVLADIIRGILNKS